MVSKLRTIDLQALHVFAEVARRGGITATADELGIAKSAVSKHLTRLEAALKVRLFERSSRRVALTKEGEMLLPRAKLILEDVEQFVDDAHEKKTQTSGTVRISASPEFGTFLTENFFPKLFDQHPQIKILLRLEYEMDDLYDPAIDLAFRLGSIGDDRLIGRQIGEFLRLLVCSPAFASMHPVLKPKDLSSLPALLFSDRDLETKWILRHRADPLSDTIVDIKGRLAIRGFSALLAAAKAGLGIARLPSFVATPELQRGSVVHILPHWQTTPLPIFVAYRPNIMRVGRVRAVIDAALNQIPVLMKLM